MILDKIDVGKCHKVNSFNYILDNSTHILIGGTNGSGKSVLIDGLIYTIITQKTPCKLVLIDPKRVTFIKYKYLPFTQRYATECDEIITLLTECIAVMQSRYDKMEDRKIVDYDGTPLYIIIDEIADIMTNDETKKIFIKLTQRLAQLGRASKIKLICATQCPAREVIPAKLTVNFTGRVALRCLNPIESRQILNKKGAETLPRYGTGIFLDFNGMYNDIEIPLISNDEIQKQIDYITDINGGFSPVREYEKTRADQSKKKNKTRLSLFSYLRGTRLIKIKDPAPADDIETLNILSIIDDD